MMYGYFLAGTLFVTDRERERRMVDSPFHVLSLSLSLCPSEYETYFLPKSPTPPGDQGITSRPFPPSHHSSKNHSNACRAGGFPRDSPP